LQTKPKAPKYIDVDVKFQQFSGGISSGLPQWGLHSDSVVFLWHCALYKFTYLLTY